MIVLRYFSMYLLLLRLLPFRVDRITIVRTSDMVKRGDLVFAKVKGHSPWPAKILKKVSTNQFKVVFFGTKQVFIQLYYTVWVKSSKKGFIFCLYESGWSRERLMKS